MKVRCITNECQFVTKNRTYEVIRENKYYYLLKDNSECFDFYSKDKFEVVKEDIEEKVKQDNVNHPTHYNIKSMECKDIISVMCEGLEGNKAYCMGAIVKYLYRFENKGKPVEDLKKAKSYINMIIKDVEIKQK